MVAKPENGDLPGNGSNGSLSFQPTASEEHVAALDSDSDFSDQTKEGTDALEKAQWLEPAGLRAYIRQIQDH